MNGRVASSMKVKTWMMLALSMACLYWIAPTIGECEARYYLINETENYSYYLDTETLRQIPDPYRDEKLIDAWIKAIPSGAGRQAEFTKRRNNVKSTDGYEIFGYSMRRYYFRTTQRQIQQMDLRDFTDFGKPLDSQNYNYDVGRWEDIVPNTSPDAWYDFITLHIDKKNDAKKGTQAGSEPVYSP